MGTVLQSGGRPWPGTTFVSVFNARTGDFLGSSTCCGDYSVFPLTAQDVKVRVFAEGRGTFWFTNATTFVDGDAVHIDGIQDTRLDIVVPAGQ